MANGGQTRCTPKNIAAFADVIRRGLEPVLAARRIGITIETARNWRAWAITKGRAPCYAVFRQAWDDAAFEARSEIIAGVRSLALPHDEVTEKTTKADEVEITVRRGVINLKAAELALKYAGGPEPDRARDVVDSGDLAGLLRRRIADLVGDVERADSSQARAATRRMLAAAENELAELTKPVEESPATMSREEYKAELFRKGQELPQDYAEALFAGYADKHGKLLPDVGALPDRPRDDADDLPDDEDEDDDDDEQVSE